jgi:hypothetical protein
MLDLCFNSPAQHAALRSFSGMVFGSRILQKRSGTVQYVHTVRTLHIHHIHTHTHDASYLNVRSPTSSPYTHFIFTTTCILHPYTYKMYVYRTYVRSATSSIIAQTRTVRTPFLPQKFCIDVILLPLLWRNG